MRVISHAEKQSNIQLLVKFLPKPRSEPYIKFRDDRKWYPIMRNNLANIHIDQHLGQRTLPNGEKVGTLGQSVDNDPNRVKLLGRLW